MLEDYEQVPSLLPPGFASLERHLDYWDRPDSHTRWMQRQAATPAQLREFYDDMLANSDAAMAYLNDMPIPAIEGADARLFRLVLALTHASIGVEIHGQPTVPNAPYPHAVSIDGFETHFR